MQGCEKFFSNFNALRFMRSLINAVPRYRKLTPGSLQSTVILILRLVLARKNATSRTSTAWRLRILPTMRGRVPTSIRRRAKIVDVDALQCRCKAVRVALATHFAVGNDIETRTLLVSNRKERCIVLSLLQPLRRNSPQLINSYPRR